MTLHFLRFVYSICKVRQTKTNVANDPGIFRDKILLLAVFRLNTFLPYHVHHQIWATRSCMTVIVSFITYFLFLKINSLADRHRDVTFFIFNGPPEDQLSQKAMVRTSPNYQHRYTYGWVRSVLPSFRDRCIQGRCYGNRFLVVNRRKLVCPPSLWAQHFTADGRIATRIRALTPPINTSTSVKNLVNFGAVTSEFYRRVCTGQATRCALPRISV